MAVFNNQLHFNAMDGINGSELWAYDGTNPPNLVADIFPGSSGSFPEALTVFNNQLYFNSYNNITGTELWTYDGTNPPKLLADISPGSDDSDPYGFTIFNNELYFTADDGFNGEELWVLTPPEQITIDAAVCNGLTYITPSGQVLSTAIMGMQDTLRNMNMTLDSIIYTINLTVNALPNNVTILSGDTITASQMGASYQWLDCNNGNAIISGETNATFILTSNGDYAVEITLNNCFNTSSCTTVLVTSIEELNETDINIYPNPSNGTFTLKPDVNLFGETFIITNVLGELVHKGIFNREITIIDLSNHKKGIYFISNTSANFKRKLLIQ